jgi:hypothetical protein
VGSGGTGAATATAAAHALGLGTTDTPTFYGITVNGSTAHGLVVGGGNGNPATYTAAGTAGQPLLSGGASADPAYGTLGVSGGGSGLATIPQYSVMLGNGTSAVSTAAPSATAGLPLVSNGASANPSFAVAVPAGGGTGLATLAAHGVMLGEGTANVSSATPGVGSSGYALLSNGPTSDPSFQQLLGAQINYNQGNVNAVTRTVTNRLQERISVMDFGCDNTGTTPDDTCFANAVAALPVSGGTVYIPSGVYLLNSFPNLASKVNITFKGAGGVTAGAQAATEIKIGQTGAGNFINGPGSAGLAFEDIQFVYSSSAFTGWIMSFGNNGSDAAFVRIKRCAFLSNSSSLFTAGAINMDKTIVWSVEDSVFSGLLEAIQGYTASSADYSNVGTIARNQFSNTRFAPIAGGGQSWVVTNNNFEGFNNGTAGNVIAGSLGMTSAVSMQGLQYVGNWHGDLNAAGGTWVTVFGGGIDINNNWFGGIAGSNAISANNVQGLRVASNYFTTFGSALSFDTAGNTGVSYTGNQFFGVTNQIANPGNYSGMLLNGGNLSATGTGAMPLYGTSGTGVNAPHMVSGSVALSSGSATVTLSGSAAFSSSSSFACSANDATAASAVKVSLGSGTSVTFTGTGTDTVGYICTGN